MGTELALEATKLCRRYGNRVAVDDVDLAVRQGEIVGLLGPNGAGKTTAIRVLTTVLPATSGRFSVAGIPSSRPALIRRRIGVLPESAGYPGHLSGFDYLCRYARLYGVPRDEIPPLADRLLGDVGLANRADSRIRTYSRGMRQRLGIARALINDPDVVFLDEPTLGLDPGGQLQVLTLIEQIAHRRGATVVLSTHTLPDVEAICDSVVVLGRGRVLIAGGLDEVTAAATRRSGGKDTARGGLMDAFLALTTSTETGQRTPTWEGSDGQT